MVAMAVDVGGIGVWCSSRIWPRDPGASAEAAAELEGLGYQALWVGLSAPNLELQEALLAATSRLAVATGIVSVWDSPPSVVAAAYRRVSGASPGRFLLGLGASHAHAVERAGGIYERPYQKVAEFLDGLDAAVPPVPADGRAPAALGPRMLALAAGRGPDSRRTPLSGHAGAHPAGAGDPGRRPAAGSRADGDPGNRPGERPRDRPCRHARLPARAELRREPAPAGVHRGRYRPGERPAGGRADRLGRRGDDRAPGRRAPPGRRRPCVRPGADR